MMKQLSYILAIVLFITACASSNKTLSSSEDNKMEEAVKIANDSLEYEILIIDPEFNLYLNTIAKPANFYSLNYYRNKNIFYVTEWNMRARNPLRYNNRIFEFEIDYRPEIDYGLDVNYKLFNYFRFIEYKYRIRLLR